MSARPLSERRAHCYGVVEVFRPEPRRSRRSGHRQRDRLLATFMMKHGLIARGAHFRCEQGTKMGRRSILHVQTGIAEDAAIDVGGHVAPIVEAVMTV